MSPDPRLVVAARELASLRREKTIVLALLIQLFVAAFSSFLVVGLVSMYDPGSIQGYTTEIGVAGADADRLAAAAGEASAVEPVVYDTPAEARAAFRRGAVDAAILAERREEGRVRATVLAPDGGIRTTLVVVQVRAVLERYETALRTERAAELDREPVAPPPGTESSPYFGFTYTVLVPLLMFLPVFIGGSVAVDSLSEEVERGTFELLRVTPATPVELLEGKLLAAAGPVPAQAGLWIGLLWLNGTRIVHVPELLAMVTALAAAVTAIGLGVAAATRDRRLAQFLYSTGLLVLFGATLLLPENPANTVARLAVGSPGPGTYAALAGYLALGALAVAGVRLLPRLANPDHL